MNKMHKFGLELAVFSPRLKYTSASVILSNDIENEIDFLVDYLVDIVSYQYLKSQLISLRIYFQNANDKEDWKMFYFDNPQPKDYYGEVKKAILELKNKIDNE